jgi:tetratricopeptide (TPR) repeat protein
MLTPFNGFSRRDPHTGMRWARLGLDRAGIAGAPVQRDMLLGYLGELHIVVGEMEEARKMRERGMQSPPFLRELEAAEGDWKAAESSVLESIAEATSRGDIMAEVGAMNALGRLFLRRGEYGQAQQYLSGLETYRGTTEEWLTLKTSLSWLCAETGQLEEARRQVERCLGILAEGDDWGGMAGWVALAEGALADAEGRLDEAEGTFQRAIETFRRYTLPWDEADALRCWGRALLRAGEREHGVEKLDKATAIYRRIGAGEPWVELVDGEKADIG